jgi:hypothetical protein
MGRKPHSGHWFGVFLAFIVKADEWACINF